MKSQAVGRYLPFSLHRRMVADMLYFGKRVPSVPVQRVMHLASLRDARAAMSSPRISWTVLFTKAFALLAQEMPVFRQLYVSFPWPRIYEHPCSSPAVSIESEYRGETVVFGFILRNPESASLLELHQRIERFRTEPIERSGHFRKSLLLARLPRFLRLWLLWYLFEVAGAKRARYFGTFGVSVYSALGAESLHPIAPWTTTINYGIIAADGSVPVRLIYDHRLMDGATVARALGRLEEILTGPILQELSALSRRESPVAA